MKEYIDISWPISNEVTTYKDKKDVRFSFVKQFNEDNVNESKLEIGSHNGTHIDAPFHFIPNGKSIDELDLRLVNGKCRVLDFTHLREKITHRDLEGKKINSEDIVLLKTSNSNLLTEGKFEPNFVYLDKTGAEFLAKLRVKAVGFDYLGIERSQPAHETHITLFNAGTWIIEGIRLKDAKEGNYYLHCMPLLVKGLDAAPARAILIPIYY